jgi:hypothetical protein
MHLISWIHPRCSGTVGMSLTYMYIKFTMYSYYVDVRSVGLHDTDMYDMGVRSVGTQQGHENRAN